MICDYTSQLECKSVSFTSSFKTSRVAILFFSSCYVLFLIPVVPSEKFQRELSGITRGGEQQKGASMNTVRLM